MKAKRTKKPIFIGGCGSSGTTLLRKMLNMHPNICAGSELSVFDRPRLYDMKQVLFYTCWRNEDFDIFDEECVFPIRVNPGNKSYFAWNRRDYFEDKQWEKFFDLSESPVEFFDIALTEFAKQNKKKRWCEKTPNNIFCVNEIMEAFSEAQFIQVIRDGRDAIMSLVERRKTHPIIAIYRWIAAIRAGQDHFNSQLKDHLVVKYEDLVERPARKLREICDFLDEKYDPIMLNYWRKKYNSKKEINDLGYGKKPVFKSSVGKWKKDGVNKSLMRMINLTTSDILSELDYEVQE